MEGGFLMRFFKIKSLLGQPAVLVKESLKKPLVPLTYHSIKKKTCNVCINPSSV